MEQLERPKVGVGLLLIRNDSLVLFGKRKNAHGDGEYAGVGGHMEGMETFAETILRELREEIGDNVKITEPKFLCLSNIRKYTPKHYIDIGMIAHWVSGEPKVMEPDKIEGWEWFPLDALPSPLFKSPENYLRAYKTGQTFFE